MSESNEPPLHIYARNAEVTIDHRSLDPWTFVNDFDRVFCGDDLTASFREGDTEETQARVSVESDLAEKLPVGKTGGKLLSSIYKLHRKFKVPLDGSYSRQGLPDRHRADRFHIDSPILGPAAPRELLFSTALPSLDEFHLDPPLEKLDDENDESLVIPSYALNFSKEVEEEIAKEVIVRPYSTPYLREVQSYQDQAPRSLLPYIGPKPSHYPLLHKVRCIIQHYKPVQNVTI
ncbi:uncharacterized protein GIQ15_00384 [Arthroderma uncinatum]|uniref:uncharacterized protein n=1 Tax=Arthroderma uncinatum TaxID=74035 RepID=UPI00144AA498|nr:uncharacterized protein GIQ15_00384 [Arthroderma uncinatum]KAF3490867.1 hypothetical protein GIQ15_00384 [Arthroderma uncinatum]